MPAALWRGVACGAVDTVLMAACTTMWQPPVFAARPTTIEVWLSAMSIPSMSPSVPADERAAATPAHYEQALGELERVVADMEAGQLPLDQLLASYRRGAELLAFCRERLDAVDAQVKVLEEGKLRPWLET